MASIEALPITALIPETAKSPIVIYESHAALRMAITERHSISGLTDWDLPGVYCLLYPVAADETFPIYVGQRYPVCGPVLPMCIWACAIPRRSHNDGTTTCCGHLIEPGRRAPSSPDRSEESGVLAGGVRTLPTPEDSGEPDASGRPDPHPRASTVTHLSWTRPRR